MYNDKKIFVLGLARSGYAVSKLLLNLGAKVYINDLKTDYDDEIINELKELGAVITLGSHPIELFNETFDLLVKNPGVPLEHFYVSNAKKFGIPVTTEIDIAYSFIKNNIIIAITGTNGKTTTTSLIYEMITRDNKECHLTGNIGYALSSFVGGIEEDDIIIVETSSHQLVNCTDFKPNISIFTNINETHLDFFKTFENYANAKKKIFQNQTRDDIAILNAEDERLLELCYDINPEKLYFSSNKKVPGTYILDNYIYYNDEKIVSLDEVVLVGKHNYENIMAAILAVKQVGISNEAIVSVLKTFTGVKHRLQYVTEINGVLFYNDSKATNITSTKTALNAFKQPVILLLGGMDRGQDFYELAKDLNYVKQIVAFGETREMIKKFSDDLMIECNTFEDLESATKDAFKNAEYGSVVLLSPACASWDQYNNFEDRGDNFIQVVKTLV